MISNMEVRDVTIMVTLSLAWITECVEMHRRDPGIDPPVEADEVLPLVQGEMEGQACRALDRDGVGVWVMLDESATACTWTAKYPLHPETPLNNRDRAAVETALRKTLASLTKETPA